MMITDEGMTAREIAESLGTTRQRVEQIIQNAVRDLWRQQVRRRAPASSYTPERRAWMEKNRERLLARRREVSRLRRAQGK